MGHRPPTCPRPGCGDAAGLASVDPNRHSVSVVAGGSVDDLIWLFEGEPTPEHPDGRIPGGGLVDWRTDWPYTTVTFDLVRRTFSVRFTVSPSYEHARLIMRSADTEMVDLDLRGISDFSVERLHEREMLRLTFRDERVGTLWVQTKPLFSLSWSVGSD